MTICPQPREGRELTDNHRNQIVNFKCNDLRGKYSYNGQTLIELVSTLTAIRDLISLLKETAKHISYDFQDTTDRNENKNNRQVERFVDREPHKLLSCSAQQLGA